MSIIEYIVAWLAPHVCVGCAKEGSVLCVDCRRALPTLPSRCYRCSKPTKVSLLCSPCSRQSHLRHVWAAAAYEGTAREAVHQLKYARAQAAAKDIAEVMASRLPADQRDWVIVPAPTAPKRVRQRGYDQAYLIAKALGRRLNCPVQPLLARQTNARQVGQSGATRRKQMRRAFRVAKPTVVQNTHILLVDDVLTTGATLEAAARVLCDAGAASVQAAVLAQAQFVR